LIKTNYKSKPTQGYKHSLGAEKISELLNGISIYENLTISFDKSEGERMGVFVPGWNLRNLKGNSKELLEFRTVVCGIYSTISNKWFLVLKPIKTETNIVVKKFLIEIGIPIIRNWFESKRSNTWYSGHRYFQIGLNENLTEFCILETQNDLVINKKVVNITLHSNGL
tara:strand:+ start:158380 stop:158883 length:504 start_codon:yes stop_codon:yes gene_type:complete